MPRTKITRISMDAVNVPGDPDPTVTPGTGVYDLVLPDDDALGALYQVYLVMKLNSDRYPPSELTPAGSISFSGEADALGIVPAGGVGPVKSVIQAFEFKALLDISHPRVRLTFNLDASPESIVSGEALIMVTRFG